MMLLMMMMMMMMKVMIMSVLAHWLLSTVCDILISAGGIGPYSLQNLTCLESLDWSGARLGGVNVRYGFGVDGVDLAVLMNLTMPRLEFYISKWG